MLPGHATVGDLDDETLLLGLPAGGDGYPTTRPRVCQAATTSRGQGGDASRLSGQVALFRRTTCSGAWLDRSARPVNQSADRPRLAAPNGAQRMAPFGVGRPRLTLIRTVSVRARLPLHKAGCRIVPGPADPVIRGLLPAGAGSRRPTGAWPKKLESSLWSLACAVRPCSSSSTPCEDPSSVVVVNPRRCGTSPGLLGSWPRPARDAAVLC